MWNGLPMGRPDLGAHCRKVLISDCSLITMPSVKAPQALVHVPILEGKAKPIYVSRREEVLWFAGAHNFTADDASCFRRVPLAEFLVLDPSLVEMEDLEVGTCAFRTAPTAPWSYGTVPVGQTYLIRFDTRPGEANPDRDSVGGAFVHCWVVDESMQSALAKASQCLAG